MKHITRNSDGETGSDEKTDLHAENVTKHKAARNPIKVSGKTSIDNFWSFNFEQFFCLKISW